MDINSYFSFSLWFQIPSISGFRLCSVAPENIAVRILGFKNIKRSSIEM